MIHYKKPDHWIKYDLQTISQALILAKSAVSALKNVSFFPLDQREKLKRLQLKREVMGTSRIEGIEVTDEDFQKIFSNTSLENPKTRSQRQVSAIIKTYQWLNSLPTDQPLNKQLILDIHKNIITGADDDRVPPGILRKADQNVHFGFPQHRGAKGGDECKKAFNQLLEAIPQEIKKHDPLIQGLSIHYHLSAIHPFLDGNGRTARALESFIQQKQGLKEEFFISLSNYYYEEKQDYLNTLAQVRKENHNLNSFILFGLKGVKEQCQHLLSEYNLYIEKAIFKNFLFKAFNIFKGSRREAVAERQLEILKLLLKSEHTADDLEKKTLLFYQKLKKPRQTFEKDLKELIEWEIAHKSKEPNTFKISRKWPAKTRIQEWREHHLSSTLSKGTRKF